MSDESLPSRGLRLCVFSSNWLAAVRRGALADALRFALRLTQFSLKAHTSRDLDVSLYIIILLE